MITVYGIKNCDTMKKAFQWLDQHGVAYDFYDYKKQAPDTSVLEQAMDTHGWENVINRKGMTWRQLPDDIKKSMDQPKAIQVAMEKPSIIKRPLIAKDEDILLGFDPDVYNSKLL